MFFLGTCPDTLHYTYSVLQTAELNTKMTPYVPTTVGIYGERKTIAWCPCTPPLTMGGKISAEACSGTEIAG